MGIQLIEERVPIKAESGVSARKPSRSMLNTTRSVVFTEVRAKLECLEQWCQDSGSEQRGVGFEQRGLFSHSIEVFFFVPCIQEGCVGTTEVCWNECAKSARIVPECA